MVLGTHLCTPEPLARLLKATLLGLVRSLRPRLLKAFLVSCGMGQGCVLHGLASPFVPCRRDHDFFS